MLPVKIKVVNFGKIEREYDEIIKFYETRIYRMARFKKERGKTIKREYILLDPLGEEMSTDELYEFFKKEVSGGKEVTFAIGPPEGFEKTEKNKKLSLSKMTFRHELAYLILLEQLYRVLLRMKGTNYEK